MIEYPARVKVLAKTRMWDSREAAHCTRGIVRLSTARMQLTPLTIQNSRLWITATQAY
jgi:hypothetical protein